ncbi:hypothetical protein BD413DRAFT_610925 [Trametes elegans]|nr:hypothetical protein BD413DRAFT_610925 [Trametes elegans]
MFHRGLAATGGLVNVRQPWTGSMGAPSPHMSLSFISNSSSSSSKKANGAAPATCGAGAGGDAARSPSANGEGANGSAADLETKVKEIKERKDEAQKAISSVQAGKQDDASKAVPISA